MGIAAHVQRMRCLCSTCETIAMVVYLCEEAICAQRRRSFCRLTGRHNGAINDRLARRDVPRARSRASAYSHIRTAVNDLRAPRARRVHRHEAETHVTRLRVCMSMKITSLCVCAHEVPRHTQLASYPQCDVRLNKTCDS